MINNLRHITYLTLLLIIQIANNRLYAQQSNTTLNRDVMVVHDAEFNELNNNNHTLVKPYLQKYLAPTNDSALIKPILKIDTNISVRVMPLMIASGGHHNTPQKVTTQDFAIGASVNTNFGKKLTLNVNVLTGRSVNNSATDSVIRNYGVIPGIGYAYKANNDSLNAAYSYQYYTGYLSYSPHRIVNLQVGRDKHFWGDGYRSLFLSDVASPYPFLKITTNAWKFTYVNLFTAMKDATNPSGLKKDWLNKYATFHYLGINVTKRIQVGFFESVVWQGSDSVRNRGYDVNYLNPIIFYRPVEYSLGSSDNVVIGANAKIKITSKHQLYGQFVLDEFVLKEFVKRTRWWGNKYALQGGFKGFDIFDVKRLHFQSEINYVRPYTYAHGSVQQNYAHMNQPLAHPLGGNFAEILSILNYHYKKLYLEGKCSYAIYGIDTSATSYGKDIFVSYVKRPQEYNNRITQGVRTHLVNLSFKTSWVVYPKMNLRLECGVMYRLEHNQLSTSQMPYVFAGLKTDLGNFYNDF